MEGATILWNSISGKYKHLDGKWRTFLADF
jgi:hypothetical protein